MGSLTAVPRVGFAEAAQTANALAEAEASTRAFCESR